MTTVLQGLEKQLVDNKKLVELRDLAVRLAANPDFKKLIIEEFCTRDCARYVSQAGDPGLNAEQRADALNIAMAAGHLKRWLSVQCQVGNHAEAGLVTLQQAIDEERAAPEEGGE